MKTYKIDGVRYELQEVSATPADGFALNGKFVYERPTKGKHVGYVVLGEGSCIECYSSFNPLKIIIPVASLLLVGGAAAAFILLNQEKDIAIGGTMLKTSVDTNIVVFNGIMSYTDNNVDLRFVNGDYETTVTVSGEGITTSSVTVAPGESLYSMPLELTTDSGVVEATVTFETATSTSEFPVLIEVPANMEGSQGVTGYFEGETLIGG